MGEGRGVFLWEEGVHNVAGSREGCSRVPADSFRGADNSAYPQITLGLLPLDLPSHPFDAWGLSPNRRLCYPGGVGEVGIYPTVYP